MINETPKPIPVLRDGKPDYRIMLQASIKRHAIHIGNVIDYLFVNGHFPTTPEA